MFLLLNLMFEFEFVEDVFEKVQTRPFFKIFFYPKRLPETALYYAPIDFLMKWVDLRIFLK